ncbi:MBL fold metallo-hydrolase [Serratia odorifera]|jgi:3',5'-cyclic-nucleotide phosphodiesterase|uniref:3',5'-cyclic-nucleotide phosphodiesterase n=2 Tax=Serratia odorifera TaxID=618 RepID=D4E9K7_SEROD|nr:MBL fold metallo-hydrolase [Serratia odorifera]EFE93524.1 3',5'-cyclic-nucleotide phosphodiesterase [Serratia odorifera DSM 4582]PNK88443.1 3',5'-cyclic-nucleotide phosphodiesterase [Serratia odorifera]RII69762.1 3',5'-cyclic-nucleotide phosphodiesterase [Serratia odorifera]VDZ65823.1 Low-affinity cAMP phosphodiesterase [Serratia odorifera]HEJ9095793.1 3',5'-cyclic-nucleotide phosphodiesterase [Serratia odorifera]
MLKKVLAVCLSGYSALAMAGFDVVALGVNGGISDGNLTSYLIRSDGQTQYVALDAGSLLPGIAKGLEKGSFPQVTPQLAAPYTPQGYVFRQLIGGYFISHAHLDHLAGLVLAAPEDNKKTLYASSDTVLTLRNHYFNWKVWPNFTDSGNGARLGTYRLQPVREQQRFTFGTTGLSGVLYPLSHDRYPSSMVLLSDRSGAFAYFGDTGPDAVEQSRHLDTVWRALGPLIQQKKLKGMIIETSYPNGVADNQLYGHLTPDWLLKELHNLQKYSGGDGSLQDLPVVISHVKPSIRQGDDVRTTIKRQLDQGNDLGVKFIMMEQGDRQTF